MKDIINASELALLLNIPKHEAAGKILICGTASSSDIKNPSVPVKDFEGRHGIKLGFYLDDCWNNYMKRPATRGWVMNYPHEKIWHGKDRPLPSKISLPVAIRGLISPEVREEIKQAWEEKYRHRLPKDIKESLIFQP